MIRHRFKLATTALVLGAAGLCGSALAQGAPGYAITEVMSGLVTPRGLAFAPDGSLYVTEVGRGGGTAAPSLIGGSGTTLYMGYTGAVSRLAGAVQSRVLTGLPSLADAGGAEASGLQDIVFDGAGQAYGLFGLGADPAQRNSLGAFGAPLLGTVSRLGLSGSGSVTPIADVAQHEADHNPAGGTIDSNPFALARKADGSFIVTDAGGNSFVQVAAGGAVSTLGVLAPQPNPLFPGFGPPTYQAVPTGVAIAPDGSYYIGQLTGFPFPAGGADVFRYDPTTGTTSVAYSGFTTIIDLEFDASGDLYVLQLTSNGLASPGGPGTGVLLKIDADTGQRTTIASDGLLFPGGLAIQEGPGGPVFYVSNNTAMPDGGSVLRIAAIPEPGTWAMLLGGLLLLPVIARRRAAT